MDNYFNLYFEDNSFTGIVPKTALTFMWSPTTAHAVCWMRKSSHLTRALSKNCSPMKNTGSRPWPKIRWTPFLQTFGHWGIDSSGLSCPKTPYFFCPEATIPFGIRAGSRDTCTAALRRKKSLCRPRCTRCLAFAHFFVPFELTGIISLDKLKRWCHSHHKTH